MGRTRLGLSVTQVLAQLRLEYDMDDVPADVLDHAAAATRRALRGCGRGPLTEARARAYFHAVVRRRVVRRHPRTTAAARVIADSVIDDLLSAGRRGPEVLEELRRGWSGTLPDEVIEEYRVRLCA